MKAIELHTARVDNSGARREAGETVTVGKADDAITPDRAKAMVAANEAVAASEAEDAPKKAADKA